MTETLINFERCCRLCAEEQEVTLLLFSPEASEMLLLEKLRKYLLIEVDRNDKLSKSICIECCIKLRNLCEFIELVRKAQADLITLSTKIEQINSNKPTLDAINEETTEFTEICVDPMDILQPCEETCTQQLTHPAPDEPVILKLLVKQGVQESEKKKFECDVCGKSYSAEQSLKNHSWIHVRDEDYSCFTCQRSFKFQMDLEDHIKSHKSLPGSNFNCDICGRRFKTHYTYEGHMLKHTTAKAFTCNVCHHSYASWTSLKMHLIIHSTERPFECSMCSKKFKRNQELKCHMNHHTGNKPYQCKFCDKSFASYGNLYTHKNRVHPIAKKLFKRHEYQAIPLPNIKYQCQICKKNCGRQENYVYHIYQHTGEKPYKCEECSIKFLTQRNLKLHYENIHPNITRPTIHLPIFCPERGKWL